MRSMGAIDWLILALNVATVPVVVDYYLRLWRAARRRTMARWKERTDATA